MSTNKLYFEMCCYYKQGSYTLNAFSSVLPFSLYDMLFAKREGGGGGGVRVHDLLMFPLQSNPLVVSSFCLDFGPFFFTFFGCFVLLMIDKLSSCSDFFF